MNHKSKKTIDNTINDPGTINMSLESVLADNRLTPKEKDKILHSWEEDQLALMRAEEENMIRRDNTPPAIDLLDRIKKAEKDLKIVHRYVEQK